MYAILSSGAIIAICDKPRYVKMNEESGAYVETIEDEAVGLSVDGMLYNISGREDIPDAPQAVAMEAEGGELIFRNAARIQTVGEATNIAFVIMAESGSIDDATAGEHTDMFAPWAFPVDYKTGNIRRYGEKLYRCLSDHISQESWTPDESHSLWVTIADPSEEWPAWSQPIGATDVYPIGAQVSHKEKHWISDTGNNVWEPGVYGWSEVTV